MSPLYASFQNYSAGVRVDYLRVVDLPGPWASRYGLANTTLLGARSAADTFSHEQYFRIDWVQTALPVSGSTRINVRAQDANNDYEVCVFPDGKVTLYERTNGVTFQRASSVAGTVVPGARMALICDSTVLRCYVQGQQRWFYTGFSAWASVTTGQIYDLGVNGAIRDLVSWPRRLSGQAATFLDVAAA